MALLNRKNSAFSVMDRWQVVDAVVSPRNVDLRACPEEEKNKSNVPILGALGARHGNILLSKIIHRLMPASHFQFCALALWRSSGFRIRQTNEFDHCAIEQPKQER